MHKRILEFMSLQTALSRLSLFGGVTTVLLLVPYSFVERAQLSLYERLHIPSPSIGLTRAYWKLIHGDVSGAWHRNKLIFVVLAVGLPMIIRDGISVYADYKKPKPS